MNKLELIKKELYEGAGWDLDNLDKVSLQTFEEIIIATEIVVKKLSPPVVVNQRELLIDFSKKVLFGEGWEPELPFENMVDEYLEPKK